MATSEEGSLNIVDITSSQMGKISGINTNVGINTKAMSGRLEYDASGFSGTKVLTETQSHNSQINISGAKAGAMTLEIDDDVKQGFWVRDETSDTDATTFRPTGGSGVVLPKNRWIYVRARTATIDHVGGWTDDSEAGALAFAGNYQVVSGRELKIYKEDGEADAAGGLVQLQGAVESSSGAPVAADTIVTLPVGYRPGYAIGFVCLADPATAALAQPVAIEITTGGAVILRSLLGWTPLANKPIDLSGISFFAEN